MEAGQRCKVLAGVRVLCWCIRNSVIEGQRKKESRVQLREVGSAHSPGTRPAGQQMREQLSV